MSVTETKKSRRPLEAIRTESQEKPRTIQTVLQSLGYLKKGATSAGLIKSAIKAFQFEQCLEVTGKLDAATAAALRKCETLGAACSPRAVRSRVQGPLTELQLARIMPESTRANRQRFLPVLNAAMMEFQINTPLRQAAFLSQVAVETGQLRFVSELGKASELHAKFKGFHGRGLLQLTWKANYERAGKALNLDLKKNPHWVAERPEVAARAAAWFFKAEGLNALADQGSIGAITLKINGGYRALDQRLAFYDRALSTLSASDTFG